MQQRVSRNPKGPIKRSNRTRRADEVLRDLADNYPHIDIAEAFSTYGQRQRNHYQN